MKYFIISLLFHILAAVSISNSMAESSEQSYQISFQTVEKNQSTKETVTKAIQKPKLTSRSSSSVASYATARTESNSNNQTNQGVINLSGQTGSTQGVFSYLLNQIYKNRNYPHESIRLKQQGQVTVRFYINENGDITDIQLDNPSSYKLLNQAAIKTLNQINIRSDFPDVEKLFKRSYSFTFDFEITKSSST
jgi:TonB family protein